MARPPSIKRSLPEMWRILRHFSPWIRSERPLIVGSVGVLIVGVFLRLAEPWPLKFILDRVIPAKRLEGLSRIPVLDDLDLLTVVHVMAIAVVVVTGLRGLFDYYQKVGFAKIGNRVLKRVRNHVFLHLQRLPLSFHTKSRSGDLITRVTRDVSLLRDVMSTAMLPLAANGMVLVGMTIVMLFVQWHLALLALATIPLFLFSTTRISKRIHLAARKQRRREGAMASTASESISAIQVVQALSLESVFAEDFSSRNADSQKEEMRTAKLSARLGRNVNMQQAVATALVMWYGAILVMESRLTPGDLLVFLTYLKRAFKPANDFAKYAARLAKATAAGERVVALLERTPEIRDLPGATKASGIQGAVHFERVSFGYEPDHEVLENIDFQVVPGQLIALIGPSGIGKSTVLSLLMRLYDPTEGRVLLDGRDLREYTVDSLRSQISVVLQDTFLFAGTVEDNIALGLPNATPAEVRAAADLAGADGFIRGLPDGYETKVGERGLTLSRGQQQRLSIARAAMRQTPILVLDEPTTGLDEENEREVLEALRRLSQGRTTFLVTHDLTLAADADLVVYLENGRLLESGPPADLLESGGRYAELYKLQNSPGGAHVP